MLNPKKAKLKTRQQENSVLFDLAQDYLYEILYIDLTGLEIQKYPYTGPNDLELIVKIPDKKLITPHNPIDQFVEDMVSTYTKRMGGHGCHFIKCQSDMGRHYTNEHRTSTYVVNGSDPLFLLVEQTPDVEPTIRIRIIQLSSYMRQVFNQTGNEVANKHNLESFAFRPSLYLEVVADTTKRCLDAIANKPRHNMDIRCTINRNYMRYVRESTQWNEGRVKIRKRLAIEDK